MSHLFGGVHEQSYIAHAIMYAGCMGEKHITPGTQWVQGFLLTQGDSDHHFVENRDYSLRVPTKELKILLVIRPLLKRGSFKFCPFFLLS